MEGTNPPAQYDYSSPDIPQEREEEKKRSTSLLSPDVNDPLKIIKEMDSFPSKSPFTVAHPSLIDTSSNTEPPVQA